MSDLLLPLVVKISAMARRRRREIELAPGKVPVDEMPRVVVAVVDEEVVVVEVDVVVVVVVVVRLRRVEVVATKLRSIEWLLRLTPERSDTSPEV